MNLIDPTRNKKYLYWEPTYIWFGNFINNNRIKSFLEVGVAGGQNIKYQVENTSLEIVYGVDEYNSDSWGMHDNLDVNEIYGNFDNLYYEVKTIFDNFKIPAYLIRKSSIVASNFFLDGELDCIFIDASHDFKNCYKDICAWYPKVKKNGFIVGHDWSNSSHPGVNKAVKKFFKFQMKNLVTFDEPYHIWYMQK